MLCKRNGWNLFGASPVSSPDEIDGFPKGMRLMLVSTLFSMVISDQFKVEGES
jgi:hypothetical protein